MRRLMNAVFVLLTLGSAVARAQTAPAAPSPPPALSPARAADTELPAGGQEADTEQPATRRQAADTEQPAARRQAADTEQPVRLRQRNGVANGSGRKHVGLLIGGVVTLGASYGFSALVGLRLMSMAPGGSSSSGSTVCTNCETAGMRLLIPIAGPWAALPASAPNGKPILAVLGIAQAAGLIMTIAGAVRLNDDVVANDPIDPRDRKAPPQWRSNGRLGFLVVPMGDGAAGVVSGRF